MRLAPAPLFAACRSQWVREPCWVTVSFGSRTWWNMDIHGLVENLSRDHEQSADWHCWTQVFATRLLLLQLQHPTIWLLDWHLQAFSRIQTWKPPESSSCQQHNITQWDCRNHATICHWQRPFASLFIDRMYFAIDFSCHQLHPTLLRGARFNPNSPLRALTLSPLRRVAVFPWWTSRSAE